MVKKNKQTTTLTHKGLAVISAIESGLCPKIEGGYDTDAFEKFWDKYRTELEEYRKSLSRHLRAKFDNNRD